jgi:hypothetical protein
MRSQEAVKSARTFIGVHVLSEISDPLSKSLISDSSKFVPENLSAPALNLSENLILPRLSWAKPPTKN